MGRIAAVWLFVGCAASISLSSVSVSAQQLLDRVLARVGTTPITLTDVRVAIGLGIVDASPGGDPQQALQQLIGRRLVLVEVQRFPPAEPPKPAIDAEVAAITAKVGEALTPLMQSTGLDAVGLHEIARENLRIRGYLDQRFGTTVQVSDEEVDQYYRAHRDEFLRDGELIPFAEAEPIARVRASAVRRQAAINQWMADIRTRSDVALTKP